MKWKVNNGVVKDENGVTVCVLSETACADHIALLKYASDMFDAIQDYLQSLENTIHPRNPKKHYDNFQRIVEKINDEVS